MKAKELMIGDWVSYIGDGEPQIKYVAEITMLNQCYLLDAKLDPKSWILVGEKYINPIPITPEILEKNGFVITKGSYFKDEDFPTYRYGIDFDQGVTISCYTNPIAGVRFLTKGCTHSYHESGLNSVHFCDIEYVHQLQHCLTLLGIDKTIEL